jgi:peptidoglycan hydrolase CwlO-like protein
MAHTSSQDMDARFNALHSNFTKTQQEVRHLNVNIATANKKMHSSINAKIEDLKQDLKQDLYTHIESFTTMIYTKMHIPADLPSSYPPMQTKGETSSLS